MLAHKMIPFFELWQIRGVNVEAVLRVEEDEVKRNTSQRQVDDDLGLSMLIDSQNNQYILTKPRDSTMPRADHHFIKVIFCLFRNKLICCAKAVQFVLS